VHFCTGLDHRETETFVVENVAQQIAHIVIVFNDQYFANARH
jgi:hypothetical protein